MKELLEALRVNFEGKEEIQRMLLEAPKWGNDDDYVDEIGRDVFAWASAQISAIKNIWDEPLAPARNNVAFHYLFGEKVGALPDGRKAFLPLSDGSLSAYPGTDVKGPTALFNSAAKVELLGSLGTLLNVKFHPSSLQSCAGIEKLLALMKSYFDKYGYHCQFNILDPETLLAAKKNPEQYRDLVVRVAGFSAFFVELAPAIQDEIIDRTMHTV